MNWKAIFVFGVLLITILLSFSRTQGHSLHYEEVYSNVVGFGSLPDTNRELIQKDISLFHDTNEWLEFKEKYLWGLNIPDPSNSEKFLVIQKDYSLGNAHVVKDIRINNNKILVYVKKVWGGGGAISVSISNRHFKDIIIISIDKTLLRGNEQIILKSSIF